MLPRPSIVLFCSILSKRPNHEEQWTNNNKKKEIVEEGDLKDINK